MELPRRYGHYVLLERIAVGGMGEIFRAKYAGLAGFERLCAIKRILPHLSDDPEFVDRLISEAMIAVQLSHANIVQIYELGKIENEYFIAMEWVDGPDLSTLQVRAKAKDLPMPLPLAIHVVHEIARAVDHAHRKADANGKNLQIVHRDISPQNVMLTLDGGVKLGDFGIARAGGIARRFVTGMGAILGKRRYMSPEQRRGEAVDARTDVYALGALLYELVSGHAPDPESPIPPLTLVANDLPPDLSDLTAKALAFDPDERLSTASGLVEGLERIFVRMAAAPGGIRDPGPELGRYVKKVCPPGEKLPQKRSLTSRIRAAMPPGAGAKPPALDPTANLAGTESEEEVALPRETEGVTIVGSAVVRAPAAVPVSAAAGTAPTSEPRGVPIEIPEEPTSAPRAVPASADAAAPAPPAPAQPWSEPDPGVLPARASARPQPTLTAARPVPGDDDASADRDLTGFARPQPTLTAARPVPFDDATEAAAARPGSLSEPTGARAQSPAPALEDDLDATSKPGPAAPPAEATAPEAHRGGEGSAAAPRSVETVIAPLLPPRASMETVIAPVQPPRGSPPPVSAPSAVETIIAPVPRAGSAAASPSDGGRRAPVSPVETRRAPAKPAAEFATEHVRVADMPRIPADPRSAGEGALFPDRPRTSGAPAAFLVAGAGAVVLVLAVAGAWAAGLLGGAPGTPVAVVTSTATPVPAPTRRPERTPAPLARPSATPTRAATPASAPTPAPTKRVAVATPPATPRPTARPAWGTLVVNAKPWARVSLDGRDLGQTPIKGLRLETGKYRIVLEHPTLGRVERQIVLRGDETERVIVDFKNLSETN